MGKPNVPLTGVRTDAAGVVRDRRLRDGHSRNGQPHRHATGQPQEAILKELMANAVHNGRFVPAGVVAATHAQEHGYTLLSCT